MLLDCAQILKGSGFFWRVRVPSAGSWGGRPGRGWVGAAGVGARASLGMTEGGWLGESVWVLRWLHTLCWELLWLSFLSKWCWVDRKQRCMCISCRGGYKYESRWQREEIKVGVSQWWGRDVGERDEWKRCWWRTKREKKHPRSPFFRHCSRILPIKLREEKWLGFHGCETKTFKCEKEF